MTVLLSIFIALVAVTPTPSIQWASVGVIFFFLFTMGYGWEGAVWLYCAEIAPLEYRHIGGAATATGEWLMTFLTVFVGPIGFEKIGWYFWLWVLSGNILGVAFVYFLCPETGGKTLEQVDWLFTSTPMGKQLDMEGANMDMNETSGIEKRAVSEVEIEHRD
jgi:hypothetical protein